MKQRTHPHLNTVNMSAAYSVVEQRKYFRLNAVGMEVDISDSIGFSTGTISDISRFGVCITDIPRRLQTKNNCITVVITGKGKRFKLLLRPRWEKQEGFAMVTGASIDDAPWDWTEMVMQMEPQADDVWGTN